jgi:uncharacterized membrane protein YhaH (DUF805 family)
MNSYTGVLRKYTVFDGRASREEYWMFQLWNSLIVVGTTVVWMAWSFSTQNPAPWFIVVVLLYGLAVLLPSLAVLIRRLHDTGREGTWFLITFVPVVGPLILFIFTLLGSQPGDNQFGPNPRGTSGMPTVTSSTPTSAVN